MQVLSFCQCACSLGIKPSWRVSNPWMDICERNCFWPNQPGLLPRWSSLWYSYHDFKETLCTTLALSVAQCSSQHTVSHHLCRLPSNVTFTCCQGCHGNWLNSCLPYQNMFRLACNYEAYCSSKLSFCTVPASWSGRGSSQTSGQQNRMRPVGTGSRTETGLPACPGPLSWGEIPQGVHV